LTTRGKHALGWRVEAARWRARRATSSLRLRPSFLLIGAQKAGTSSLHDYLAEHPAVLCGVPKEIRYFNRFYVYGEGWYRAHFPLVARAAVARRRTGARPAVGEGSASYLFHPLVPERVHTYDPTMKLIPVVRDPVDRAYSHYQMEVRWGRETLSFEDALAREERELGAELERLRANPLDTSPSWLNCSYVARGRYAEQLERWLELFPREQLLVLTSDELLADPAEIMLRVADFLELPRWQAERYPLRGVREYSPMPPETRERLARVFEPHNRKLEDLLDRKLEWTRPAASVPSGRG